MPDPTIIRAQTLVQGNLTGEDPVEVEGQLIGQVALHNTLTVHPGGLVRGQLHVTQAVIFGRVEGTLTATERVYLGPSAIVIADVEAPLVRVDDGAKLHGKLLMDLDAPASSPQAASEAQQPSGRGERAIIQPAVAPLALPSSKPAAQQAPKDEPKPSFGSFTSPSRPVATQPAAVTAQPVVTAPSFVSAKPQQTTSQATQPTAPAPQPTRTAVAVVEPEPTPEPVEVAAPGAVEPEIEPEVEPEIEALAPDPVAVIEPELAEETVVEEPHEEPHDAPDEDDAPAGGEDDAADAYAAEAAKYEHYTVKELREELRRLDLPVSGSKEDLIERLINAQ